MLTYKQCILGKCPIFSATGKLDARICKSSPSLTCPTNVYKSNLNFNCKYYIDNKNESSLTSPKRFRLLISCYVFLTLVLFKCLTDRWMNNWSKLKFYNHIHFLFHISIRVIQTYYQFILFKSYSVLDGGCLPSLR